jgi:hypothetical protein
LSFWLWFVLVSRAVNPPQAGPDFCCIEAVMCNAEVVLFRFLIDFCEE